MPDAAAVLARQDRIPIWALPYSCLVIIGIGQAVTPFIALALVPNFTFG